MRRPTHPGLGRIGLVSEGMVEPFVHVSPPGRVVLAPGALDRVPDEIDIISEGGVLLIAGGSAHHAGDRVQDRLGDRVVARLTEIRQHVPEDLADQARAQSEQAQILVSIGGGSATGLAKAVALTTGLPILAVPTTYAGSEMTPVWGVTSQGEKRTGTNPRVLPRTVVYDPELSRHLPLDVTVPSVANAMAHCVEAVWTTRADPITNLTAVEGARVLAAGLATVRKENSDIDARSNLLYGACLAGSALATAGTGLHHKICHVLGGTYGLPHAQTHAAVLPHVTALNSAAIPRAMLGTDDVAQRLYDLFQPGGLKDLGLTEDQADEIADTMPLPDNPVPLDRDILRTILHHAWEGRRPA
jgi:maleylacetate reductase